MVVCLKKKNFIFSHFWRIEVQNQGVNRAMFSLKALEKNPSMLLLAFSGCWPFVVFPGFLSCVSSVSSNLPLLLGTLDIRFRTNPNPVLLLFSHSVLSNSLRPHELQHTGLSCPSPSSGPCSTSCPHVESECQPAISSVVPFSCLQSFPASGSFPVGQLLASSGQSIGASASASVLPVNIQDWFPLGWTCLISFQFKGLSRVFSNTTIQKHPLFGVQPSL